jgi:polyhydroxyalkanoate synthesis regulator phasin
VSVTKRRKLQLVAASVAAVAVAGSGVAIAATKPWSPREESQAVIDDAAKQLGVTPSALTNALKKALENRIDAAVADGRLTKEQGQQLKNLIESKDLALPLGPLALGLGKAFHFGFAHPFAKFDAAASYLGLSPSELGSRLAEGKTLAEIAKAQGKSVDGLVDVLVTDAEKRIDDAVADGKLTKVQGQQLKSGLRERMSDLVNGDLRFRRGPHLFAPGFGFGFGRPGFFPAKPRFGSDFRPDRRGPFA